MLSRNNSAIGGRHHKTVTLSGTFSIVLLVVQRHIEGAVTLPGLTRLQLLVLLQLLRLRCLRSVANYRTLLILATVILNAIRGRYLRSLFIH